MSANTNSTDQHFYVVIISNGDKLSSTIFQLITKSSLTRKTKTSIFYLSISPLTTPEQMAAPKMAKGNPQQTSSLSYQLLQPSVQMLHNTIYQHNTKLFVCLQCSHFTSLQQLVYSSNRLNIMKASIINTLNIFFALVIFTPFVYTQTSSKVSCKNATEKTISLKADYMQPTEQAYLINIR